MLSLPENLASWRGRPGPPRAGGFAAAKIALSAIGFARECAYIEPEQRRFFRRPSL